MIEFLWPWVFYLLPLPIVARFLLPGVHQAQQSALRTPFLEDFSQPDASGESRSRWLELLFAALAWILLVTATARPQWVGEPIEFPVSGRDLLMAVDLSDSMRIEDFVLNGGKINRLDATKKVAEKFIAKREGDRIGLILFGDQAYVQTPLTFDRETVNELLQEAFFGLAGTRTAIGDAIGLAVKRLQTADEKSRVLILLTDGQNTAGELDPVKAAELAANIGLKIYTIGIGADEMIIRNWFGSQRVNPSQDLDEKTLTAIAQKTGGRYFRARDVDQLEQIYALLDQLEPVEQDKQSFRPTLSLFHWPMAFAFLFSGLLFIYRLIRH